MSFRRALALPGLVAALTLAACGGGNGDLILATTTSTENSGLLDVLVPAFEDAEGFRVKVIAVGSGAALEMGRNGDADVLLVHSPAAEGAFMAAGSGLDRTRVMYNDFVIVGPPSDPAGVREAADAAGAMKRIAGSGSAFISRGDDSGTHALEKGLWVAAGVDVPKGQSWYTETGQGMSATLTVARERDAYSVTDRATWLATSDVIAQPLLLEGDERLLNVYHVIVVNAEKHNINEQGAEAFRAFLVAPSTQRLIGEFGEGEFGQALFFPYAE